MNTLHLQHFRLETPRDAPLSIHRMNAAEIAAAPDPMAVYQAWFDLAQQSEPNDPNAVALATATPDGIPSLRMVLMKHADAEGFRFFTNIESRKGHELLANPRAALCFHWKTLRKQIRVTGPVELLSEQASSEYFHSRSHASQISAAISHQSSVLTSRSALEEAVRTYAAEHPNDVPLPAFWRGFLLRPTTIEFWQDGENRLHDRTLFQKSGNQWSTCLLYP